MSALAARSGMGWRELLDEESTKAPLRLEELVISEPGITHRDAGER